jgi:D-alanyl-D-alanine dipeptidase
MSSRPNRSTLRIPKIFLIFAICVLSVSAGLHAQFARPASSPLEPGPKPPDVSSEWKKVVGIYRHDSETVVILERARKLYWSVSHGQNPSTHPAAELAINTAGPGPMQLLRSAVASPNATANQLIFRIDDNSNISGVMAGYILYSRSDAGADPSHFYHITLKQPLDQLRAAALVAQPPTEPGPFRQPDLVELSTLDPAIHLDIRYAHDNNFLSTPVYTQARAFMQRPAADALLRVLHKLQPPGYGLLIHDAYRPWYVTKIFWDATPPEGRIFVADPAKGSKHNRGCAVDLTLYNLSTGQPIEMPGLYDEMSPRSFPTFSGGTSLQRWHRDLLRRAMESEGFTVNEDEWWHFDYKDWKHYPILNTPFEKLAKN